MTEPAASPMPRPREVKVATMVLAAIGAIGLLTAWLLLTVLRDDQNHGQDVASGYFTLVYLQFAFSGLQVISAVLLWLGSRWGRVLGIVLCAIDVIAAVANLGHGAVVPTLFGVVLNIVAIRALADSEIGYWVERH